jgi:hypothetical protein
MPSPESQPQVFVRNEQSQRIATINVELLN